MDITEKLMLLSYISKSEDEKKKDEDEDTFEEDKIIIRVTDINNRGDIYKKHK